jgi:hypothetical protein
MVPNYCDDPIYCDDLIWLSPDNALIEMYVHKLRDKGYDLTLDDKMDIFGFYPVVFGILLSFNTQSDIQHVDRFSRNPKQSHSHTVNQIVRYLLETSKRELLFKPGPSQGLDCWVADTYFADMYGYEDKQDPISTKSRTGFVLTLFGCPVLWSNKFQPDITLSFTAAEYVAFSMAMRELLPLPALLQEPGTHQNLPLISESLVRSTVFKDNLGVISLLKTPKMAPLNKYWDLCTTEPQANILTTRLPESAFATIQKLLMDGKVMCRLIVLLLACKGVRWYFTAYGDSVLSLEAHGTHTHLRLPSLCSIIPLNSFVPLPKSLSVTKEVHARFID